MISAVQRVRERLTRAVRALEAADVRHAVIEDHAVAAWVSRVDEAAVRNTQDVDLLLRRSDLDAAKAALAAAGFVHRHVGGLDLFLDGPHAKARDAVHLIFAGEKVRPDHVMPAPDLSESEPSTAFRLLNLESLVCMKLTSWRDRDRMHLRDLLDVGLIDATWCDEFPATLAERLRRLMDMPEG